VNHRPDLRRWVLIGFAVVAVIAVGAIVKHSRSRTKVAAIVTEPVARRDIARTIEATGTVEPIDLVEVKSKASGQITKMPVQVGSVVKAGDLLAQIDARDVRNQYDQTLAALRAADSKVAISKAQRDRSEDLFRQAVITAPENESATLDYANSQAALVKARTDLDLAKQRLDDATVRAPISGTVLEQDVSAGQVISSATSSASGGTSLLKMADLSRIRLRALVGETDIGDVHTGQSATVTVDAFPNRNFEGVVEKVEPQAVVQQSVTMFPVLVSISNEGGLLMPGMNGEVVMLVERREGVLAIPVDAVRTAREVPVVATALGLKPDSVRAQVQRQVDAQMREFAARRAAMGDSGRRWMADASYSPDSSRRSGGRRFRGDSSAAGMRGAGRRGGGAWASGGGAGGGAGRRGNWAGRNGGGGSGGFGGGGGNVAGGTGGAGGGAGGGGGGAGMRGNRAQVVFVKTEHGLEPRVVRLGLSDFDYFEVISGVNEGEQVALLGIAEAQAARQETQNQIRQRMGGGVPGVPGGGGGRVGGGGAGGGGAGRGGGGGGAGRGGS